MRINGNGNLQGNGISESNSIDGIKLAKFGETECLRKSSPKMSESAYIEAIISRLDKMLKRVHFKVQKNLETYQIVLFLVHRLIEKVLLL